VKFLLWIAGLIALVWLVSILFVQQFLITSNSMENLLQVGDRVVVNHTAYWFSPVSRGDVVVFNGRDSYSREDRDYVKRVIGLPGDRVMCCDSHGRLIINGQPFDEVDYLFPGDSPSEIEFDIQVPDGKYWLMGDHRSLSSDSRSHLGDPGGGFVSESAVKGQVIAVIWPPSRLELTPQ
jgi:signal peptidase I